MRKPDFPSSVSRVEEILAKKGDLTRGEEKGLAGYVRGLGGQIDNLNPDASHRVKRIYDLLGWQDSLVYPELAGREEIMIQALAEFEGIFKDIEKRINNCRYSELFFEVAGLDRFFAELKPKLTNEDIAGVEARIQKMFSPELNRLLSEAIESGKDCAIIGKKQSMKQFLDRINGLLRMARKLNLELDLAKYKKPKQEIVAIYREAKLKKQLEENLENAFEGASILAIAGNKAGMEKLLSLIESILEKAKDSKLNWDFAQHEKRIKEIRAIYEKNTKESPEAEA